MILQNVDVPESWMKLEKSNFKGIVMIVGGTNTGKTTFSHYIYSELKRLGYRVAYLDGDPGQSSIGPPTTMSLNYPITGSSGDYNPRVWRSFVGSISPRGNMLRVLISAKRLSDIAQRQGAQTVIYDTSGLIDPVQGGLALKLAKIDLLRPSTLIAFQREHELKSLILPFRNSKRIDVEVIKPSDNVIVRDQEQRKRYRADRFRRYFYSSEEITINWENFSIFPTPSFAINRLIALVDEQGLLLTLGIILSINWAERFITIKAHRVSLTGDLSIYMGNVFLNPDTFEDRLI